MMPQPGPGAHHSRPNRDRPPNHLTCECQRTAGDPRSLCGLSVRYDHPDTVRDVVPPAEPTIAEWCVVCHDLMTAARAAGRCQRCPS
jgi:hypothetical protein